MAARVRTRPRKPAPMPRVKETGGAEPSRLPVLDPIITMNSGGVIQSASDSVEQVFGWTPTELFGRNVNLLIPEPRRSALDRYLDRYRQSDRTGVLEKSRRFEAVRKDGTLLQIELSMSRADLPAHGTPYFIGIVRDVSRQIDAGTDSHRERVLLQKLITEQTRALATANLRLQLADRLAALGTLAAGLGHDMNNVLLPVRARLNALEHAGITSAALAHVKAVRRSVAYLQHLSDGLHFLAIDPEGPGVAPHAVGATDLAHWWRQVGALLRKAAPKHVKMTASFPAGLPMVHIAPHWITHAMLNIIINAGEAIPPARRGGTIRIWAAVDRVGRQIRIGVTDNGRGMTRAVQHRAMDLFFTTKSRSMGTGLGLPLAQKVASRAGGNIEIKSVRGRGTTVALVIPAESSSAAPPTDAKRPTCLATVGVKDHRTSALIAQILLEAGVRVRPGSSKGPGKTDLWIIEPKTRHLAAAQRWHSQRKPHALVALGSPPASTRNRWLKLGATLVEPPDDFEAIRHALGLAIEGLSKQEAKGANT